MGHVLSLAQTIEFREQQRTAGKRVVFTNGLFDILHVGHLDYLERARALGDVLIVGLNSDDSARTLKGDQHPILPQDERARLLAALQVVDVVTVFEELTATHLIQALSPDLYVKGGDYARKEWPERAAAEQAGCQIQLIPFLAGHSTTELIQTILSRFGTDVPIG